MNNQELAIDAATKAKNYAERAIEYAIECGNHLIEVKKELNHGEFIPWVNKNMPCSYRQCSKYLKLSNSSELLKRNHGSFLEDLSVRKALELIQDEEMKKRTREKEKAKAKAKTKPNNQINDKRKEERDRQEKEERWEKKQKDQEKIVKRNQALKSLGISQGLDGILISEESLKILYKGFSQLKHPDKGGSQEEFIKIKQAYEELKQ